MVLPSKVISSGVNWHCLVSSCLDNLRRSKRPEKMVKSYEVVTFSWAGPQSRRTSCTRWWRQGGPAGGNRKRCLTFLRLARNVLTLKFRKSSNLNPENEQICGFVCTPVWITRVHRIHALVVQVFRHHFLILQDLLMILVRSIMLICLSPCPSSFLLLCCATQQLWYRWTASMSWSISWRTRRRFCKMLMCT